MSCPCPSALSPTVRRPIAPASPLRSVSPLALGSSSTRTLVRATRSGKTRGTWDIGPAAAARPEVAAFFFPAGPALAASGPSSSSCFTCCFPATFGFAAAAAAAAAMVASCCRWSRTARGSESLELCTKSTTLSRGLCVTTRLGHCLQHTSAQLSGGHYIPGVL